MLCGVLAFVHYTGEAGVALIVVFSVAFLPTIALLAIPLVCDIKKVRLSPRNKLIVDLLLPISLLWQVVMVIIGSVVGIPY